MTRMIQCIRLGHEAEGMDFAPYPGELGQRIYDHVSKPAWQEWMGHQTMLINDMGLVMSDPQARKFLAKEMEKYFFGEGSARPEGYVAPDSKLKD